MKFAEGFVARYKKGANEPDGNTEFQFKAGDLNFHSSSYQWLVVVCVRAQFKGEGTINGAGHYGSMLPRSMAKLMVALTSSALRSGT